ncbi:MAG: hypothetical protein NC043_05430 [Muribaculaceae bacterium]|nr:hypothetical protein [Muribaculaceae bacterium]
MSKKNQKKPLLERVLEREEVNLTEYSIKEIEHVIKELVEMRLNRIRTEKALRLLEAVQIAVGKTREILEKEE